MATRYWVGGSATWTGTTHWSAASALTFTASCTGVVLTTTGSPTLVVGMTVWSNNNTSLGTIASGSGNSWVVTVGGTYTSQGMTAATVGASAPTTADNVIFNATSSLVSYTVTTSTSPACQNLTMDGPAAGIMTFAGTNNLQFTGAGAHTFTVNTPSTINFTNTGSPQFTGGSTSVTLDTNGCPMAFPSIVISSTVGTVALLSDFTASNTSITAAQNALNLNNHVLTCFDISFTGGTNPSIAFGTGKIVTYDAFTGNTNLSVTGTPVIELASSGSTGFIINSLNGISTAAISFKTTGNGTYPLTVGTGSCVLNFDLTGHAGTLAGTANNFTIFGNLLLSSNPSFSVTGGAGTITFAGATGTKTIQTNNKTLDRNINFNAAATWVLQDALTVPTTSRTLTQTAGTLDMNGKTLTVGGYATAAGTKNLTFNGGNMIVTNSGTTAFNNAAPTNYSTTAGAGGLGTITMSATAAKTFVGGGSTYAASIVQAGTGSLTFTGNNTFSGSLKNSIQPTTLSFTSLSTNTFTGDIKLKGTAGSLVTIIAVTSGSAATLSHTGTTVSCDYISLKDNTATGATPFYAGAHSTLVSNTTNWSNRPPPSANTDFLTFF